MLSEIGADENVTKMMFLAICYSANVGGTGTLIGEDGGEGDGLMKVIMTMMMAIIITQGLRHPDDDGDNYNNRASGTPPNLIMYDFLEDFADQPVNFLSWMGILSLLCRLYYNFVSGWVF